MRAQACEVDVVVGSFVEINKGVLRGWTPRRKGGCLSMARNVSVGRLDAVFPAH